MICNLDIFNQTEVLLDNKLVALDVPTPRNELPINSIILVRDGEHKGIYEIKYYIYFYFNGKYERIPKVVKIDSHSDMEFFEYILKP